jgi:hypothetical protein
MKIKLKAFYKKQRGVKTPFKTNIMKETLLILQEYAKASDNLWLHHKMQRLETEIKIEILNAEIEIIKQF